MGGKIIQGRTPEQNYFVSISDFKWCMSCGGEVEFDWAGQQYGVSQGRICFKKYTRLAYPLTAQRVFRAKTSQPLLVSHCDNYICPVPAPSWFPDLKA